MSPIPEFLSSGQELGVQLYSYFKGGGVIMYPLLLVAIYMWTLIFERIFAFHRLEFRDLDMGELLEGCRDRRRFPPKTGLRAQIGYFLCHHRTTDHFLNRRLLDQCCMQLRPKIDKNIMLIAVLAMVSPLLGLLGTVTGMITTFDVIALFGTGNARALAGGISEALITTQSGLLVSIPGVFSSAVLSLRARRLQLRLDESMTTLKRIV
ncbi:outer membrane transport energization protein ExbB (TC 2.C.1.1.1) [Desulfuromusa kysingii]|uniref:Outer membrane transport energization protein ExbB (TC 2.C.1.1.1) n=1 Tax=Desulfuromusa kysingii TaxID=37625 RepID=A0A1H3VT55_9BACT|nr:MotA/TolQ/ExbB proton channel family protein [Desulfuromusa kysingii]SDZ77871.1 outer membrane transport energization protein ExbB (TC 2.C.1.1.1) [Desulfuromusa kysingii]